MQNANIFKDLQLLGLVDVNDPVHIECLRFCFMDLIPDDLKRTQCEWNLHYIYAKLGSGKPSGKPDKMYYLPDEFATESFGFPYNEEKVVSVQIELNGDEGDPIPVPPDFVKLLNNLLPNEKLQRRLLKHRDFIMTSNWQ